jgi:putative ABC transport system substrate-binding protein
MTLKTVGLLITLTLGILAAAFPGDAQPPGKVYRIGLLGLASTSDVAGLAALRQGLRDLGYEEGKNLVIEYRWAEGKYDRLPGFAAELVRLKVDVLVTYGTPGAVAAKQATTTIPVVMAIIGDAVAAGVVASLARPGGNITGSQFHFPEVMAKRIEMLREAMPRLARVAVLINPANPAVRPALKAMEDTARYLRVELQQIEARSPHDFDGAFAAMVQRRSEAFAVADDPMLRSHGRTIAELATRRRLPSVGDREYAEDGGLLAYGVNRPEVWRRAAVFIDKILKGAKPADLPVEQADRLQLVINLKTAKALGLTIPQSVLIRGDELIQ